MSANTITQVEAKSEIVEINEAGGPAGRLHLSQASLDLTGEKRECFTGFLTPAAGTVLRLARSGGGPLTVMLDPSRGGGPAGWLDDDQNDDRQAIRDTFVAVVGGSRCPLRSEAQSLRIPIFGPLTIGREFSLDRSGGSNVLISGHINTFVRALPKFLAFHLSGSDGVIIPAQSVEIPSGVRLVECAPADERVPWYGFVEVQLGGHDVADRALAISATTSAHRLALIIPGGQIMPSEGANGQRSICGAGEGAGARVDVIGLSLLGRMTSDPNAALIPAILLLLLTLTGIFVNIHAIPEPPK